MSKHSVHALETALEPALRSVSAMPEPSSATAEAFPVALDARLTGQGRMLGYGGALVAVGSFLTLWVPNIGVHAAGRPSGTTYLALGLALAGLLALATASGRRLAVGLGALLVAAGPWGPEALFPLLYLLLSAWMTVQVARAVRCRRKEMR